MGLLAISLRRALFGVGPVATLRALVKHLRRADPELHGRPAQAPAGPHPFDRAYGVDTGGVLGWRALQSGGANDPYISGYIGVAPSIARRLLAQIDHPERYTFIDIGCGKGRAAIIATERPFRRILGIEIAAPLAEAAAANAAIIARNHADRTPIEIVHADAAAFDLPPDPLALFLYQPFEKPVMRVLLDRLAASLAAHPRPVILLYLYPALAPLLDRHPHLERRADGTYQPDESELPYSYGGRGGLEPYAIWTTTNPSPPLVT